MASEELYKSNNDIEDLERLSDYHYENIFNVYKTGDGFYGYNVLKTVIIPEDLDPAVYDIVLIDRQMSWTNLSFLEYGTIKLWWLICLANRIQNPVQFPSAGMRIKVIKKDFVGQILKQINDSD
jgi:hypothetical protein